MNNTGQIIKTRSELPFAQIPNELLRNPNISARAKGLMCFLLSLPADWVLYKSTIHEYFSEGREAIRTAWEELVELGYVVSVRIIGENNLTVGWNHVVYYDPVKPETLENTDKSPCIGFPETREPVDTKSRTYTKKETSTKKEGYLPIVKTVVEHLNLKTESSYRETTSKTVAVITARLNEGNTLDDFIAVIDDRTVVWKNDPKMNEYLRPETLFGTKFESYLQSARKKVSSDPATKYEILRVKGWQNCSTEDLQWAFDYQHRTASSYTEYQKSELLGTRGKSKTVAEYDAEYSG